MSADSGQPARFVCKVFDPGLETVVELVGEEWIVHETPAGRYQFKLLIAREAGNVKELWIQRVPAPGSGGAVKNLLNLGQPQVGALVDFLKALDRIPVEGDTTVRLDDDLVRDLVADPTALSSIYQQHPDRFRSLIADDVAARDLIAVAARRRSVEQFQALLADDDYFDNQVAADARSSPEGVWQSFFESNPWIFGVSLTSQLLTGWSDEKLEQVVAGAAIGTVGKRTDALMRTAGLVQSMVFAEIKTHRTPLLAAGEYRSGCWAPSKDLVGGVAQVQGTVHRAVSEIGERIARVATDGSEIPGEFTYLIKPRSLLILGKLSQLTGTEGGDHRDKIRSFELFRRGLIEPEVVTFDELLARAQWAVESASAARAANQGGVRCEVGSDDPW